MEMGCLSSHGPQSFSGDTTPLLDLGRKLYWIEEYQFTVLFRYIKKKGGDVRLEEIRRSSCTSPYLNAVSKLPKSHLTGVCQHLQREILQSSLAIQCFSLLTVQGISFLMSNRIILQFYYILTGFQLPLICRTCLRMNTTVQSDSLKK